MIKNQIVLSSLLTISESVAYERKNDTLIGRVSPLSVCDRVISDIEVTRLP